MLPDSISISYRFDEDGPGGQRGTVYRSRRVSDIAVAVSRHDEGARLVAGEFAGTVFSLDDPRDSLTIRDGRFDVRYGVTP